MHFNRCKGKGKGITFLTFAGVRCISIVVRVRVRVFRFLLLLVEGAFQLLFE